MKPLLIILIIGVATTSWSQSDQDQATFEAEVQESRKVAINYYPDLLDGESELRKRYVKIKEKMEFFEDPALESSNHPFLIAQKAANELGIKPKKLPSIKDIRQEFKTATGEVYKLVTITKIEPDGISIQHESGATKVKFNNLTSAQREEFGLTEGAYREYQETRILLAERLRQEEAEKKARNQTNLKPSPPAKSQSKPQPSQTTQSPSRYADTEWTSPSWRSTYWFKGDGTFRTAWMSGKKRRIEEGRWESASEFDLKIIYNNGRTFTFRLNPDNRSITRHDNHVWHLKK